MKSGYLLIAFVSAGVASLALWNSHNVKQMALSESIELHKQIDDLDQRLQALDDFQQLLDGLSPKRKTSPVQNEKSGNQRQNAVFKRQAKKIRATPTTINGRRSITSSLNECYISN